MDVAVTRGRGPIGASYDSEACLCYRPRCHVLCTNCGFHTWGRVRHSCPRHPQTVFLIDLTQCPKCRAYTSLLCEYGELTIDAEDSIRTIFL